MELTHTIQAACHVTASLNEAGECVVKVFAAASYNETGGTATAELKPSAETQGKVRAALTDALRDVQPLLGDAIARAIHTSREAAKRLGE